MAPGPGPAKNPASILSDAEIAAEIERMKASGRAMAKKLSLQAYAPEMATGPPSEWADFAADYTDNELLDALQGTAIGLSLQKAVKIIKALRSEFAILSFLLLAAWKS